MTEMFKRCLFILLVSLLPLGALAEEGYKILADRSVVRALPRIWAFENLTDRLFRNADGTVLYLGPGDEKEFFIIRSATDIRQVEAPSIGKAYMDEEGQFVIWYDRLDKGVEFKNGAKLTFGDPTKIRFGVAYGGEYFFVYENQQSRIFRTSHPTTPILTFEETYVYKIAVAPDGELFVFSFRSEGIRQIRKHEIQRWQSVNGTYEERETFVVPRHYQVMDVDTAHARVLLLNESQLAPQVFDWDLKIDRILPVGTVDSFAIYMNKDFAIGEDMIESLPPRQSER